jgi:hypothetical protein
VSCQPADDAVETQAASPAAEEAAEPVPATTAAGKIDEAAAAAPTSISAGARILDWPAGEGQDFAELREGDNGWTCLPDHPGMHRFQPMCLDSAWMQWLQAFATGTTPQVDRVGFGYMITADEEGSNTDPTATEPTPDNQWHSWGPHVMVVFPDAAAMEGIPTEPRTDGPYVMWGGTPYGHVMLPWEDSRRP